MAIVQSNRQESDDDQADLSNARVAESGIVACLADQPSKEQLALLQALVTKEFDATASGNRPHPG
jgi:hypothetical protein